MQDIERIAPHWKGRQKFIWRIGETPRFSSLNILIICGLFTIGVVFLQAQEQSFPTPAKNGVLGRNNATALSEIKAYLQAVSASGWKDLRATGTLTYPNGGTHPATLYLMGPRCSRLDIEMGAGTRSLRLSGFAGRYETETGEMGSLPVETASAGIVAFPRVWSGAATSSGISFFVSMRASAGLICVGFLGISFVFISSWGEFAEREYGSFSESG